jgi:hypothetical protein
MQRPDHRSDEETSSLPLVLAGSGQAGCGYDLRGGLPGGRGKVAMKFRILGSFEVLGKDGALDLRGAKRRGLLAGSTR